MNHNIPLVFSILLFAGILVPAYAQTSENVVINEVDINPPGDDSASISEWVELYNPTDSDINIGGWEIASTTILKKTMTIQSGTVIKSGQFLIYSYQSAWFTDAYESVELRDENGIVIDKTRNIDDNKSDFTSWQRIYDGFDSDNSDDWKFVKSTAGLSNGKLIEIQDSDEITMSVSSEKSSYLFGDVAVISGSVSEERYDLKPFFQPAEIVIHITGPNFDKTLTMYPDMNLNYDTTLSLHQVLGINEGTYDVSVSYDDATANTSFSVGFELIEQKEKEQELLSIITDKSQYLPGQLVSITGFTSEIIQFQGMKLTVYDSRGELISGGSLYPTNGEFASSVYITTISPSYGVYEIYAEYFDKSVSTTFEVVEDIKEDVPISLWTDNVAYGLGDEVVITGRLNDVWIGTVNLEILQTKQSGLIGSGSESGFKILDGLTIMGDGSFSYTFTIPDNEMRLGDYRIGVSQDIGSVSTIIHAVSNPEDFIASDDPLTIDSDKESYELGDKITLNGFVKDPFSNSSYSTGSSVKIFISDENGTPLEIIGLPKEIQGGSRSNDGVIAGYSFSAVPETSGRYSVQLDASQLIFTAGNYTAKAQYGSDVATKTFTITDLLDLKDGAIISLDKEVYGLAETVYLTGIVPPTGDNSIEISITKPDGSIRNSGAIIDNQRFSWSWVTPISEKQVTLKDDDDERDVIKSNFGVYKIKASIASESVNLFFKVSADPENDSLSTNPLFVTTEKLLYKAGEKLKVTGNVIKREQGDEGLVVPERVSLKVIDAIYTTKVFHESLVYPNQGGDFTSLFELPVTIFSEGEYIVRANYLGTQTESRFSVANDFTFGGDVDLSLLLETDKSEYYPGDTVVVSGKPSKLVYLEKFEVSVIPQTENEITCGSFICGMNSVDAITIRPSPSASFTHEFTIPNNISAIGSYKVNVDADFETKSIQFNVIEKQQTPKSNTLIEKENRLSEDVISIFTSEKTVNDESVAPRVISGSLITPTRGDESSVNLKISTPPTISDVMGGTSIPGTCIIGPDADCLVQESTRKQGEIYDVVEVDGMRLNVRYSGPDVRLEKFSILPESSDVFLPNTLWNVEIIKDDQVSRFYYKVTYKTLE